MKSKELNDRIRQLCDNPGSDHTETFDLPDYDAFGGKPIAYIGWFWRNVDFDTEEHTLGVIPTGTHDIVIDGVPQGHPSRKHCVGFMENNKWGYPEVKADKETWADIKRLLEQAVLNPTRDNLKAVDDRIQALAVGKTYRQFRDASGYVYWTEQV